MEKQETKEKIEREYVIPLRQKFKHVARYKKTPKAVKTIKEFILRHMKIYDGDLNKIKIDSYLNEALWIRGIKNPIHKIKVKAIKEGEIVRVEAVELPKNIDFKKKRLERKTKEQEEKAEKKKAEVVEEVVKKESEIPEEKKEKEGKKAAVIEAGKQLEKAAAKQEKHIARVKSKQPKHQFRKALAK